MLLTEINETFKGIKSLLAKLFMTTDSAERGINGVKHAIFEQVRQQEALSRQLSSMHLILTAVTVRLESLEKAVNSKQVIYVSAPAPSPLPTTDAPLPWSDRITCDTNSPLGPFRERAPKTATTVRECLEDDFHSSANPPGTAGAGNYVPAPRGERVGATDYGCNIL